MHINNDVLKVCRILLVIGGLNWGLIGLGLFLSGRGWNIVNMIFGGAPLLEALIYLAVGVATLVVIGENRNHHTVSHAAPVHDDHHHG